MVQLGGVVMVFVMVFGGFMLAGGHFDVIIQAAPLELVIILGSGIGAFIIGNSTHSTLQTVKDLGKFIKGPKWSEQDYTDLLCLLFLLTKTMKSKGVIGENHQGYLEFVGQRRDGAAIVKAENADRKALYTAIAKKTGASPEQVGTRAALKWKKNLAAGEYRVRGLRPSH